uniref:Uncharacterized protein n=1 Tax=Leersia perrieri TaxID=77586 RepID=A0A0D9WHT7_9ORYZ
MAYRRKQGMQRSATFVEDHRQQHPQPGDTSSPAIASPRATRFADDSRRPDRSLAAQAMLASASSAASSPNPDASSLDPVTQMYTSTTRGGASNDPKHGFWGVLAQQAKEMLDENGGTDSLTSQSRWSYDRVRNPDNPVLDIGGKIKNVLEEGLTKATGAGAGGSDAIHGGRKLQIRRKTCSMDFRNTSLSLASPDMSPMLSDTESPQIKASRDVASAMAAKVKLLQRELKTVKADMAFSKERCAQLEEENRLLRGDGGGGHGGGAGADDEDLIRQQLETLLAEKARLANDNTVYARENRFLREIVEFHQLNMQDVVEVDLDDDDDEEDEEEERSPLAAGGRMRVMSRSNSGAGESPLRRSLLGLPETPPTRRSLKEEDDGGLQPETPPTRRSLKEEDVDDEPLTPPTRRSLKEEDVDEPGTPPTRRSLKEEDVVEPETPPTRRSLKEEDVDDVPETPPTRRSFKEEEDDLQPETPPTRRSIKEDVDDGLETPPTRRSFKEYIGSPEKVATTTRRSFKEDIGSPPEIAVTPTRRSSTEDIASPEKAVTPTRRSFKEDIVSSEKPATPRPSFSEELGEAETATPTCQNFEDESGKTETRNED